MLASMRPGFALLPLRLFLGATFVYGGLQKLSDPGFLHAGAPTYIGTQLRGFANHTPGGFLLRALALPHPVLAGVGVALAEIAVGVLTVMGLRTRPAAGVGLTLNLMLFLTASWHTHPYFLGSDIVFVFAWLPFLLAGAVGQPALDRELSRRVDWSRSRRGAGARAPAGDAAALGAPSPPALSRRDLMARATAAAGVGTLTLAGLAELAKGSYRGSGTRALASAGSRPAAREPAPSALANRPPRVPPLPSNAVGLAPSHQLGVGQAAIYRDPRDGSPDVVVRRPSGELVAHSAVCTHAGCQVVYQSGALVCPCHDSVFNADTGDVEQGPAIDPLPARRVIERAGHIYAIPT